MNRFILIRGIGFLFKDDFRMMIKEILIIEADMPYNAQAVGDDAEFIGIAEMAVNVELFNVRVGGELLLTSQFYHKPVRSCSILSKKKA